MCGIVGYVGDKSAVSIIVEGLKRLEYRGYDSAGIAVLNDGTLHVRRAAGRLKMLEGVLGERPLAGSLGIGHTRLPEIEHLDPWSASLTRITFGMLAIWTLAMIRRAGRSGAVRVEEPHLDSLETRATAHTAL